MRRRSFLFAAVAVVASVGWLAGPAFAAENHEGIVVKTDEAAKTLTMTDKDGKNEHTHNVPSTATITLDGKTAKLSELVKGYKVTVTTSANQVTKVEAQSV
jgi:hypothetical protein